MAYPPLSDDLCKEVLKALKATNGHGSNAALALGLNRATFQHRLDTAKARFPALYTRPQSDCAARTLPEELAHRQSQDKQKYERHKLELALKEISELSARLEAYEHVRNVSLTPPDWVLDTRQPRGKSVHIPVLFFSDAQAGEVVRTDETETPWPYNSNIFRQRYRRMIVTTIDLATNHRGERWSYPGIIYLRGGDNVSGGLHEDLRELGEDCTPMQQARMVAEEEVRGIELMAEAFGKVDIETPGSAGNHDRMTRLPPSKLAWARSYDLYIHDMLAAHFKRDKRVTFHVTRSADIKFPIFGRTNLLTHGDKIGSRGGMGFVGPGATILRGWQKVFMEQARLHARVDMLWTGHFHWPMETLTGIANGSFTGTTEYGKGFRADPIPPMQYLTFWHSKHGQVDTRKLWLA